MKMLLVVMALFLSGCSSVPENQICYPKEELNQKAKGIYLYGFQVGALTALGNCAEYGRIEYQDASGRTRIITCKESEKL